jgi:DNA-binding NtrC family response regulator
VTPTRPSVSSPSIIPPRLPSIRVLAIEQDERVREQVRQLLTLAGHSVRFVADVELAVASIGSEPFDAVLADVAITGSEGLSAIAATPTIFGAVAIVAGLAHRGEGTTALLQRAHGWITRPYDSDELLRSVERAAQDALRGRELAALRSVLGGNAESVLIGRSPAMQRLRELVQRAASSRATVIVSGESGTGKELVARTIHAMSDHARGPCVMVECTGRDAASLEAELFGTCDGTPLGGSRSAFTHAGGGTVILDDATSLPAPLQAKLLRLLQERALADDAVANDFRLLITVHEQRTSGFGAPPRYDLLGRAGVFSIVLPPLRDRRSDIPLLASHFRARFARDTGAAAPPLTSDVVASMLGYEWPGNVRQLEHYVGRLLLMAPGARVPFDAPSPSLAPHAAAPSLVEAASASHWTLEELEREYIKRVLDEARGHQSRAATLLGIDRRTLYRKLKQYKAQDAARRRAAAPAARGSEKSA